MPTRTGPISAFLTNTNVPLGTEFDDGLRSGPVLDRTVLGTNGYQPYSYTQWGLGLLNSADNTYNIVPAGPGAVGNVVFPFVPAAAGNVLLAGDNFVTSLKVSGTSSPANLSQFVQFDWARALSLTVAGGNFAGPATVTVFGTDCWGVPLQEAITFQNAGTYNLKKAFYTVTRVFYNGVASGGPTMSLQTTDTLGLPYRLKSSGDINSIRWGNFSDLGDNSNQLSTPVTGVATLVAGTVIVPCSAVTALSNIQVTRNTPGGVLGNLSVPVAAVVPGVSFTINSDAAAETSTVNWEVVNPLGQYAADGHATFVAGAVTVYTSQVQDAAHIQLSKTAAAGAIGQWRVTAVVPGVSFTVTSNNVAETSTFSWVIIPQNWNSGTSASIGSGGTAAFVFVPTSAAQSNSKILLTYSTLAGTPGVLEVRDADIVPGSGFAIRSTNVLDTSTVNWAILNLVAGLTQGTATLNGGAPGTIVVPTTAVLANSVILVTYNTFSTPGTYILAGTIVPGTSFTITSQGNADASTVNWAIFPVNFFLQTFIEPLGTFTPADDTVATNTTGDVRGTYLPSTPANGINVLHLSAFISGYDNFVNQQADANLSSGGTPAVPLTRGTITVNDQVGVQQYYTGIQA